VPAIADVVCDARRGHPDLRDSRADHSSGVTERKSCFRSAWGAEASAIRTTARKQARNLLDDFRAVPGTSLLHALPARS
jgi:hypothetical protein